MNAGVRDSEDKAQVSRVRRCDMSWLSVRYGHLSHGYNRIFTADLTTARRKYNLYFKVN